MKKYIAIAAFAFLFIFSSNAYSQSEPPYGMTEIQAYSVFYDNFRQGHYDMALQFGRWMLEKKPREIPGASQFSLSTQYRRMIDVYTGLAAQENDPAQQSAYIDSAVVIYDEAFELFGEDEIDYFEWHINRGRFYQENRNQISGGLQKAYEEYEAAFQLDAEKIAQRSDGYFAQILLDNYISHNERDKALELIDKVEPHAGAELSDALNKARNDLFSDPEERIVFLESRLENAPDDEELIGELASLYESQGNREKAREYAERGYQLNPTYESARKLADIAQADAQYQAALGYLQEAIELTDNNDEKKRATIEIADIHQNSGDLRSARQYARQAISLDRSWGQPYIRISSIYASAVTQCSSGRQIERDDQAVYWLVLDYLDRARSVDSSLASEVQRRYRTYEPMLPSAEDKFFRGWEAGDEINVDGNLNSCYAWIGETTRVR